VILLDTHIWIRWLSAPEGLPAAVLAQIEAADALAISAISCWELGQLVRRQRLTLDRGVSEWIDAATAEVVQVMPVDRQIAELASALPEHHRDPADRLIIATAIRERIELLSLDRVFPLYQPEGLLLRPIE